jgi:hypothetical protein
MDREPDDLRREHASQVPRRFPLGLRRTSGSSFDGRERNRRPRAHEVPAARASALSEYLTGEPDLDRSAAEFFALQDVLVDALWAMGEAVDTARTASLLDPAIAVNQGGVATS